MAEPGALARLREAVRGLLLPEQAWAYEAWRRMGGRGVVALPTGTGKTVVGLVAVLDHLFFSPGRPGVLILVPYGPLVERWVSLLRRPGWAAW